MRSFQRPERETIIGGIVALIVLCITAVLLDRSARLRHHHRSRTPLVED
jgi:hypothetical protein